MTSISLEFVGCRLPHGRRGLKLSGIGGDMARLMSPSSRKAGIEIPRGKLWWTAPGCRLPHGRRGLKFFRFRYCGKQNHVAFLTEGGD